MGKRKRQVFKRHRDRVFENRNGLLDSIDGETSETKSAKAKKAAQEKKTKNINDRNDYLEDDTLHIRAIDTNKHNIYVRPPMKAGIIPTHPTSTIFNGRSGSGKSTLLLNLMKRPLFYGPTRKNKPKTGYFDEIFLFAPTAKSDDMFQEIIDIFDIPDEHIFTTPSETELQSILDIQRKSIESKSLDKADKLLFIFEDIVSNARFMRSKPFLQCFVANRHYNASTWICTQSFTKVPRACRLQANNIFYFEGSHSELEIVSEEYCPPGMNKKDFQNVVKDVTRPDHNFLFINRTQPFDKRYRENLQYIIKIRNNTTGESTEESVHNPKKRKTNQLTVKQDGQL